MGAKLRNDQIAALLDEAGFVARPQGSVWWIERKAESRSTPWRGCYIAKKSVHKEIKNGTLIEYVTEHMRSET